MKQCFGYIRVSTQKQGLGVSLDAQRDAIERFAERNRLEIVEWFEEKETAAKSGRPVFSTMLRRLRKHEAAGLIMHKIDRSARNLRDWALVSELPRRGIDVYFATEALDFHTRGGRLSANLQAVIAEDYIYNLREETIKGLTGRLKQGLYPFRAPIGYLDNGKGQPKTPCPVKAPLIIQAFELYASGDYSIRTLLPELEKLGLRNQANKPVSKTGLETILSNPFYTGLIVIKRTGASYKGIHRPLISARLFERVQDIKAGRSGKKFTRHNHLYRGLFRCGLCDSAMSPELQKGRVYYRCQVKDCATTTIREDMLEERIVTELQRVRLSTADADRLHRQWLDWAAASPDADQLRGLDLTIAQVTAKSDRLVDLLIDGSIDQATFNAKKLAFELESAKLKERKAELETSRQSGDRVLAFLELMKNLAELHVSADDSTKRRIVRNCFSNRTVVGRNAVLTPYSWLKARDIPHLSSLVPQNGTLLELLTENAKGGPESERTPQWRAKLEVGTRHDRETRDLAA